MKRFKHINGLLVVFFSLIVVFSNVVFGSWYVPTTAEYDNANPSNGIFDNTVQEPVCYINTNTKANSYPTIEGALKKAKKDDYVVVLPPSSEAFYPQDGANDKRTNKTTFLSTDEGIQTSKVEYTISSDCEIKQGVTLIIPYETVADTNLSSSSNFTKYLKTMKTGTHESKGESVFYQYDSKGNKTNTALINFHGAEATSYPGMFLRTTVNIADNVTLTNNGTIVVGGMLSGGTGGGGNAGQTSHFYSKLVLGNKAKIVQSNSSASIYCFGFIEEISSNNLSSINIANGSIYIPFIIKDAPEFWSMLALANNGISQYEAPPFNQFVVKNVEPQLTIGYNGTLYAMQNLLIYASGQLDKENPNDIMLISNSTSSFIQFTSSSYAVFKYDKANTINESHFYGGFKINSVSITISPTSSNSQEVRFNDVIFPISFQHKITLSKNDGANVNGNYNFGNQKVKILPGAYFCIDQDVDVTAKTFVVYSAFADRVTNGKSNYRLNYASVNYPIKDGALCKILSNSSLTASSLGGAIYADETATIATSIDTVTTNEVTNMTSCSLPYLREMGDSLLIKETFERYTLSDLSKNKLFVGVNILKTHSSYIPSFNVVLSDETSILINGYQKVILYDNQTTFQLEFLSNVYTSNYYVNTTKTYYTRNKVVNLSSSHIVDVVSTNLTVSSNNNGINEFDIQSISVEAASEPVILDGVSKQAVIIDQTEKITANIVDFTKIYDRTVTFKSSNESVLSIKNASGNECEVQAKALGESIITATCSGMSDSLTIYVVSSIENLIPIDTSSSGTYITTVYSGKTKTFRNQTKHTHPFGNNASCNSTPDLSVSHKSDSKTDYLTFNLHILPTNADVQSITWKWEGDTSYLNLVDDAGTEVKTVTGAESVRVWEKLNTSSNGSADTSCLSCTVVDKLNNPAVTYYICIKTNADACFTADTLLTLSNGSHKKVSELSIHDEIKVVDHETGKIINQKVLSIYNHGYSEADVIDLKFDNNMSISLCNRHYLFDVDLLNYVDINASNAQSYVGHSFLCDVNGVLTPRKLLSVDITKEYTQLWSIMGYKNHNVIANDIVTLTPIADYNFSFESYFDFDSDYKYDPIKKQQDIDAYGLYTYDEWSDYMSEWLFEGFNAPYVKVMVGKGLITTEEVYGILTVFMDYAENGEGTINLG